MPMIRAKLSSSYVLCLQVFCLRHRRQFKRPRNPSNPDPEGFDQSQAWKAQEIQLDDGRILILETI